MAPSSFIDPSSLTSTTSPSPSYASPSPSPSSPAHDLPSASSSGPSRKRARTELSSEERKEARAHRNRIAAQNSRDRRKAQYTYLERRVQDLEEENRRLRAGIPIHPPPMPMNVTPAPPLSSLNLPSLASLASAAASAAAGIPMRMPDEELRIRREQERERENEELKERIKTLERGWDAVVKALAAQGLPTGISVSNESSPSTAISQHPPSTSPTTSNPSSSSSSNHPQLSSAPTTPLTSSAPTSTSHLALNGFSAFPSPAPSHTSFDLTELEASSAPSSTPFSLQPSIHTRQQQEAAAASPSASDPVTDSVSVSSIEKNSTRHLARVASIEPLGLMALQRSSKANLGHGAGYLPSPTITDDDDFGSDEDAKMEDLFREIFVETTASTAKDEASDCVGIPETAASAGALWGVSSSQAQVEGEGKSIAGEGLETEGPQGAGSAEIGERQVKSDTLAIGEKRKREADEEQQAPTTMTDAEMQRMLSDIEVSMMMGNFDPSLPVPMVDNFGSLDMSLLGFGDQASFMDFASGPDFGNMWPSTNSTVPATGVF